MKVLCYTRVSTAEQADKGYSLQYQETQQTQYCDLKKYTICNNYKEDYSAKTFDRPEWNKIMIFLKANKGLIDKIVFSKWDRFSRNSYEAQGMIKTLEKLNVKVECIEQPLDLSIPDNLLLLNIYLAVPEIENRKNSQRTKSSMRQASKNGCWMGKPPFGFNLSRIKTNDNKNNATIIPNENAPIIIDVFNLMASGMESAETIRKYIFKRYQKKLSKQGVLDILKNNVYIGKIVIPAYNDEKEQCIAGMHEPIISNEIFNIVQDIIKGKRRKHKRTDKKELYPLKTILGCNMCQRAIIGSASKGRSKSYPYYHCSEPKGHDRNAVDLVHKAFDDLLKEFTAKEEVINLLELILKDITNQNNTNIKNHQSKIENQIEDVSKKIKRTQDFLASADTPDQNYIEMLMRFNKEKNELVMKHATLKAEFAPKPKDLEFVVELFRSFDKLYNRCDYDTKIKMLGSIFTKPLYFSVNHFRTEEVSPLLELIVNNSKDLKGLKIKTSHLKNDSSTKAPPSGLEPETL